MLFAVSLAYLLLIYVYVISDTYNPGDANRKKCSEYIVEASLEANESDIVVAGGRDAKPKELPFMAALGYQGGNDKRYLCGGSLISDYFVLTAAHCLFSRTWGQVKYVRLGDLNLTSPTDDVNAQEFQVNKSYIHPLYVFPKKYHDIALIQLNKRVKLSPHTKPVCLYQTADLKEVKFFAAGWGLLGHEENPSDHLQVGELKYYPLDDCQRTFPADVTMPGGIRGDHQLCAGAIDHIVDTCKGDSGGPLAYASASRRTFFLAGVTSFGKACALGKIPAIYTKVSYYLEWIESIVWPEELF